MRSDDANNFDKKELEQSSDFDFFPADFGAIEHPANESDPSFFPRIEGYTILELLDNGGMGSVYRAIRHGDDSRFVAIKTIRSKFDHLVSKEETRRFFREISILSNCRHPNVVEYIGQGTYRSGLQQLPYYVMELIEGGDLQCWLETNELNTIGSLKSLFARLEGAIYGLHALHELGFVHRDLKPANLMIGRDEKIKVGDFGLAKHLEMNQELTKTIGNLGTTPYSAPEQLISAKSASRISDVYSIGVILYQIAAGNIRPFQSQSKGIDSENEQIALRQRRPEMQLIPPSHRGQKIGDQSLDFICLKCLEYFPEHRYQDAAALAADLKRWRTGASVRGGLADRFRNQILRPTQRNWKKIAAATALFAMASVTLVLFFGAELSSYVGELNREISISSAEKRRVLVAQLNEKVQLLPGGENYLETLRHPDFLARNKENLRDAKQLARQLELNQTEQLNELYLSWCVEFADRDPTLSLTNDNLNHLKEVEFIAAKCVRKAKEQKHLDGLDQMLISLLRSKKILADFYWREGNEPFFLRKLNEIQGLKREVELPTKANKLQHLLKNYFLLLHSLKFDDDYRNDPNKRYELCTQYEHVFEPASLTTDDHLQSYYMCWYFYQHFRDASYDAKIPAADRLELLKKWHRLHNETPYVHRDYNPNYLPAESRHVREIGSCLVEMGDFIQAEEYLTRARVFADKAVAQSPESITSWYRASEAYSSLKFLAVKKPKSLQEIFASYEAYIDICKQKMETFDRPKFGDRYTDEIIRTLIYTGNAYNEWALKLFTTGLTAEGKLQDPIEKLKASEEQFQRALQLRSENKQARTGLKRTYDLWIRVLGQEKNRRDEILDTRAKIEKLKEEPAS